MNENLIFEGNTIYELDPECMRVKREAAHGCTTEIKKMSCGVFQSKRCSCRTLLACAIIMRVCGSMRSESMYLAKR